MKGSQVSSLKYHNVNLLHYTLNKSAFTHSARFLDTYSPSSVDSPFDSIIPISYTLSKNKALEFHFNLSDFDDTKRFCVFISNTLSLNVTYTVYIKLRYDANKFLMAGNQFGFTYYEYDDTEFLLNNILEKLELSFTEYLLTDERIVYVQVTIKPLSFEIKNELKLNKLDDVTPK